MEAMLITEACDSKLPAALTSGRHTCVSAKGARTFTALTRPQASIGNSSNLCWTLPSAALLTSTSSFPSRCESSATSPEMSCSLERSARSAIHSPGPSASSSFAAAERSLREAM